MSIILVPGIQMTNSTTSTDLVLLTGASGYVGARLLPLLAARGARVRCLARDPGALAPAGPGIEVCRGDLLAPPTLPAAMQGVHTAYYLVHSMGAPGDFAATDRAAARNFGDAAKASGVRRIIYLGGLGEPGEDLSPHLRSRQEVGDVLRESGVEVIEFRASIVIGSGSLSFEMIRSLVERLPVMVTPRWVRTPAQPIAVADLLRYLAGALDLPPGGPRIFEVGGADPASYGGIMREYAAQRGLRRAMIPVPVLTPRLSGLWLGLVTPFYARVGRHLVDSLRNPTVVRDDGARRAFSFEPMGMRAAIAAALADDRASAPGRGSGGASRPATWLSDERRIRVAVEPLRAFGPIRRIGGPNGYYYGNWLWRLRGWLDAACGGVGLRPGRREPDRLSVGDPVDFWRVEEYEEGRLLRLAAEMKLPGRAWLEYEVSEEGGGAVIRQTALFDPRGLAGLAYWFALYPVHQFVFAGMLRGIARESERSAT